MTRPYNQKLFADVYRICIAAAGPSDAPADFSEIDGAIGEVMKTRLAEVFDRIYDEGYVAGQNDAEMSL